MNLSLLCSSSHLLQLPVSLPIHLRKNQEPILKSGTTLKVTLWGQANQQLPDDVVTASAGCPILVVTSSTVKLFDGNYSLSSTTATKIYVNLDIPEVAHLKETNSNQETTVKLIAPSYTAITLEERMVSNRKTLVEIVEAVPNAAIGDKFTCKGVISEVIYDYEPFYFSCNNKECRKKVVPRGSKHWCDNCKNFVDYPVAKYKIHVEIRDRTQSVSVSIFDREVERLLKLPVTEMIDLNTMDNGSESVKDILNKLVGLEFVFEIKISEFNIRNEDGDASFTASKVWVVNEEIEARHFTESIEATTAFLGVFDGHGGPDVAANMKKNAMNIFFKDADLLQTFEADDVFLEAVEKSLHDEFLFADLALANDATYSNSSGTTALTALILGRDAKKFISDDQTAP